MSRWSRSGAADFGCVVTMSDAPMPVEGAVPLAGAPVGDVLPPDTTIRRSIR
jgi:hypothetical protein